MIKQEFSVKTRHKLFWSIISFGIIVSSCANQQQNQQESPPIQADFMELKKSDATVVKTYPGTIEGTVNVDIRAQVTGYLESIFVKEGDYVKKGQPLFKIKSDIFNEQVNSSKANLQSALAAQGNAKIELDKIRPLVEAQVYSQLQLETAESQYRAASAQVEQAKAALGTSKLNADFAIIKAPVSGYIGLIPNRIGNLVTPTDAVPLTNLSEINEVYVYFTLSEAEFIDFESSKTSNSTNNSVEIITAAGTKYPFKGRVEVASGNIDRSTGTIALKAVFANPDKILRSGGAARIVMTKSIQNALTVPMASVKDIQDRYFVYTLNDSSKITMKPMEVAARSGNKYVIKSGLSSGDKIALNSIDRLSEGIKVTPKLVSLDTIKN